MKVEAGHGWKAGERARVREHLLRAERLALRSSPAGLGQATRRTRALLLDELARYRLRGRFPQNREFSSLTPYFVGPDGTRCAVAHLLDASGESTLVRKIAGERNNARVLELSNEPRLLAWLGAAGLTLDEVAAIQPSYACVPPTECFCQNFRDNVVEAVAIENAMNNTVTATVTRVVRGGEGVEPGDAIEVFSAAAVSGSELVAQSWSVPSGDGGVVANYSEVPFPAGRECGFELTRDEFVAVAAANDCKAALVRVDPNTATLNDCDDGCSCAIPGGTSGSAPTSLGILMALASAAALRRSRKRSPRT